MTKYEKAKQDYAAFKASYEAAYAAIDKTKPDDLNVFIKKHDTDERFGKCSGSLK
jgi:hypothetical protein